MNDTIDKAFQIMQRAHFLPDDVRDQAESDIPLPIGFGQTSSQPTTVRLLLMWLDPAEGEKILDVGSGSGWTTALISYLVGPSGCVYAVEREPGLVRFGAENCRRRGLTNVHFHKAGSVYGLPPHAPYDGILVSAAASRAPQELLEQLKVDGRMVIPVQSSVLVIHKTSLHDYESKEYPGFNFVPLV